MKSIKVKWSSEKRTKRALLVTIIVGINLLFWLLVMSGCAVRGLHLDEGHIWKELPVTVPAKLPVP